MKTFICGSLFSIALCIIGGYSTMSAKAVTPATTQAAADTKSWVMQSAGTNVLKLSTPGNFKCAIADGSLHFTGPQYEVEFWLVNGAQTVDDALKHVSTQISSEFKDFKPDHTTDLTVARSPAKRLVGSGHEADDGDPGDADVIVFKVGGHIFIACNHGESLNPAAQQGMATLVQTAQKP
jgi:hypothetical protein